jgi:hypothetical protein
MRPTPRQEIFDIYWTFAAERQQIFEQRLLGAPGPWTDDPILLRYKFCNVFRAADRVSQYLIRQVAYRNDDSTPADRAFQIVAFRTFSNIATWDGVTKLLSHSPRLSDLASGDFEAALNQVREVNGGLYTGAFILCATDAYGRQLKHLNHVELFKSMFLDGSLYDDIARASSLEDVYNFLHEYPLMGDFMSYQIAIDLNYSELIDFSEDDFTKPGPGAVRGIKKVFENIGDMKPDAVIHWMVERQEKEFARLGLEFGGLYGRRLHAIDVQNLFCEVDKYCREAAPHLASARTRIKSKFSPSNESIALFFPPKWGLNSKIARQSNKAA